ncbi:DUF6402 family protein [Variovorax boronicumulans]|uniref:DUF6402 family protein n=1 Tax=Variovorax boronicumulans TaxID=436515 RepID=UPI0012E4C62D|nr:DUF6402 family protein [Variovorax boronicumulans]GER15381.1 hypothetical protein VCH24_03710 [Variovorax boronicumulans]
MPSLAGEKIDFRKSNNFMRSWSPQTGEICREDIALSTSRAPPPVRGRPAAAPAARKSVEVPARRTAKQDPYVNTVRGAIHAAEAVSNAVGSVRHWLNSPPAPPPPPKEKPKPVQTVPPFDIQDIPGAMRKIGAPVGADLMDKWFAGALNYPPTPADEQNGINQNGVPYPPGMFDTTSVKIDWVLKFARARKGLAHLMSQLETPRARDAMAKKLRPYRNRLDIRPWLECKSDIVRFHKDFQFQQSPVEGTLSQKLTQFITQSLFNEGLPDDLTCALGSFNLYAAVSQAWFDHKNKSAVVTHISVYVKDNFTFTDEAGHASQYLGHWSRSHVAIVPAHQTAAMVNIGWLDYPVAQGDVHAKDAVLYPVKNSDFRAWQRKHNQGGDFIIYTDMATLKLDTPITVAL